MKKAALSYAAFLLLSIITCHAQLPRWQWARHAPNLNTDQTAVKVCTDGYGNVFTLDIQGGLWYSWNYANSRIDTVCTVRKYSPAGALQWSFPFHGAISVIAADSQGNVYATGGFSNSVTGSTVAAQGGSDIFVAAIGPFGALKWTRTFGSSGFDAGKDILVGANDEVYVTGTFTNAVQFGQTLLSDTMQCFFMLRMDGDGSVVWAKVAPPATNGNYLTDGYELASDRNGDIYVLCGRTIRPCEEGYCVSYGMLKFNAAGASQTVNREFDTFEKPWGLAIDDSLFIYVYYGTGSHYDSSRDIAKLRQDGSLVWSKWMGAPGYFSKYGYYASILFDSNQDLIVGGATQIEQEWNDTILIEGDTMVDVGRGDVLISRMDRAGKFVSHFKTGTPDNDFANALCMDKAGNIVCVGGYGNPLWGQSTTGTYLCFDTACVINSTNHNKAFVAKYEVSPYVFGSVGIQPFTATEFNAFPNPSTGVFNFTSSDPVAGYDVYDALGNSVRIAPSSGRLDLSSMPDGVYFLKVRTATSCCTKRLQVIH